MRIQQFSGETMAEAIASVRQAFGPNALILSTKTRDTGGATRVEVMAAPEGDQREVTAAPEGDQRDVSRAAREAKPTAQSLTALMAPLEEEIRSLARTVQHVSGAAGNTLSEEVAALRELTEQLLKERTAEPSAPCPLLAAGLDLEVAEPLRERLHYFTARGGKDRALRLTLEEALERHCVTPLGRYRHEIVVGPLGAGKTTSVAKLVGMRMRSGARALGSQPGRQIGVIALESRDGREAVLRTFCHRNALPFQRVRHLDELRGALRAMGRRHVFVEIHADAIRDPAMSELRSISGRRTGIHLVVPATTRRAELEADLKPFREIRADTTIANRAESLHAWHDLVNLLLSGALPPLGWLSTGPDVQQTLGLADPKQLAELIAEPGS